MSKDFKSLPYIHSLIVMNISIWICKFSSEAVSGIKGSPEVQIWHPRRSDSSLTQILLVSKAVIVEGKEG